VAEDRTIMQVQAGEAVAVTHGDTILKADGTLMGRRLAALSALRDQARRVLHAQNAGRPETERQEARRTLNRVYDRFVDAYGLINKTTVATTRDGTIIRRLPNCPFTHNLARLPGYASNVVLPGYASSRVACATDERA
jgi:N12 class adenine-specific DNA methylase